MADPQHSEKPPEAPPFERRVDFSPLQLAGVLLIAAIPLAALAGAFGESWEEVEASTADLRVRMTYPDRFRYKQINAVEIRVENTSSAVLDTVTVRFDEEYITKFSNTTFIPSATEAFAVPLTDVRPGETRLVVAKLQAERYWLHDGAVRVSAAADTATLPVRTLIFP